MKISLLSVMFLLLLAGCIRGDELSASKPTDPSPEKKTTELHKTTELVETENNAESTSPETDPSTLGISNTTATSPNTGNGTDMIESAIADPTTRTELPVKENTSISISKPPDADANPPPSTNDTESTSLKTNSSTSGIFNTTATSPNISSPTDTTKSSTTPSKLPVNENTSISIPKPSNADANTPPPNGDTKLTSPITFTSKISSSTTASDVTSTSTSPPATTPQSSINPDAIEPDFYTSPPYISDVDSEQIEVLYVPIGRDGETTRNHRFVAEKIQNLTHNNTFITNRLINMVADKSQLSHISDPFDVRSIKDWKFDISSFGINNKLYNFTNITAIPVRAANVRSYKNQFICVFSNHLQIDLDLLPDNLHLEGQFWVQDNGSSKTAGGPFEFNQYGGQLSYKINRTAEVPIDKLTLADYGDFIYSDGQVKITHACKDQCDILASAADMFNEIKRQVLNRIDSELILKRIAQLSNTFPFMSTCLSPPPANPIKHNYYIINSITVEKYKSFNLELGPIIIKGLDKITRSSILAHRVDAGQSPNFTVAFATDILQGQCDWKFYKTGEAQTTQHSFTFTIDNVLFALDPQFRSKWTITELQIKFGGIGIHRSDKACPRIHEFTKDILRENLREIIHASLKEMFYKQYPKTSPISANSVINKSKWRTTPRKIVSVNITKGFGIEDEDVSETNVLPFNRRVVPGVCKDNRSWWRKLFGRKKC